MTWTTAVSTSSGRSGGDQSMAVAGSHCRAAACGVEPGGEVAPHLVPVHEVDARRGPGRRPRRERRAMPAPTAGDARSSTVDAEPARTAPARRRSLTSPLTTTFRSAIPWPAERAQAARWTVEVGIAAGDPQPLTGGHRGQGPFDQQVTAPVEAEAGEVDLMVGNHRP